MIVVGVFQRVNWSYERGLGLLGGFGFVHIDHCGPPGGFHSVEDTEDTRLIILFLFMIEQGASVPGGTGLVDFEEVFFDDFDEIVAFLEDGFLVGP